MTTSHSPESDQLALFGVEYTTEPDPETHLSLRVTADGIHAVAADRAAGEQEFSEGDIHYGFIRND